MYGFVTKKIKKVIDNKKETFLKLSELSLSRMYKEKIIKNKYGKNKTVEPTDNPRNIDI